MGSRATTALAAVDGMSGYRATATAAVLDEVLRFIRLLKANLANPAGLDRASLLLLLPLTDGPKRLRELADVRAVDQSTVSRQAAELVKVGLVRRDPDPADRRARLLVLTERGRALTEQLVDARLRTMAEALANWDAGRIGDFAGMFGDFNEALERRAASGSGPVYDKDSASGPVYDKDSTSGKDSASGKDSSSAPQDSTLDRIQGAAPHGGTPAGIQATGPATDTHNQPS